MGNFTGAALYTKDEIENALTNREKLFYKYKGLYEKAINTAKTTDTSYIKWGYLWWVKRTAYEDMLEDCCFIYGRYLWIEDWLKDNYYLNEGQKDGYKQHVRYFEEEELQVKKLFNGGKDCYLNPEQAGFINIYKDIECE